MTATIATGSPANTFTTQFHPLLNAQPPAGAKLVITRTAYPPKIDGKHHDSCWEKRPWHKFVKADGTGRPKAPSSFKICYDNKYLYVMFYARRPPGHRSTIPPDATGHDQASLFKHDALQLFIQPGGKGKQFFQIALSPKGGVYDQSFTPGNGWMTNVSWDARGVRVSGLVHKGGYFVEAAVPFAALHTQPPKAGTYWRGNLCRSEHTIRELTSWAPSGGRFATPGRFGVLIFSDRPPAKQTKADKTGHATVRGKLVRPDGKPAAYVQVRAAASQARSNAKGEFELKQMPTGAQTIALISPAYQQRVGQIKVQKNKNSVAPITLTPIDPYRPAFSGPLGAESVAWLKSSIIEPFSMKAPQAPKTSARAKQLALLGAPGQYVSRAVAFYLNENVSNPKATIQWQTSGPSGKNKTNLKGTVRWVSRDLDRQSYLPRQTAKWTWRFVWHKAPSTLKKGHVRMLIITVHVPKNAAPGKRRGKLVLLNGNTKVATLPLSLTIAPFHLAASTKKLGIYYYPHDLSSDWAKLELKDIRAHGGSILFDAHALTLNNVRITGDTVHISSAKVVKNIRILQRYGFLPPYLIHLPSASMALAAWRHLPGKHHTPKSRSAKFKAIELGQKSPIYPKIVSAAAQALSRVQKQFPNVPLAIQWMDEVFNHNRLPRFLALAKLIRPLTDLPIYMTVNNKPHNVPKLVKIDPYLDIRAYHGMTMDKWLAKGHTWSELAAKLNAAGDIGWTYYNDRGLTFTPEDQRLTCGYWLWRSPLVVSIPWIYNPMSRTNNPFNTMDSASGDILMAARDTDNHQIVSTLDWEAYRQGYNDLCYLATLQQAIKHDQTGSAEAQKAKQWLADLRKGSATVKAITAKLTPSDYRQRRWEMAKFIEKLTGLSVD